MCLGLPTIFNTSPCDSVYYYSLRKKNIGIFPYEYKINLFDEADNEHIRKISNHKNFIAQHIFC